jgi:hypothetical protein
MAEDACGNKQKNQPALTIPVMWARMISVLPFDPDLSGFGFLSSIVGLWRSWERASMAWKRSSVRSRPGPPSFQQLTHFPTDRLVAFGSKLQKHFQSAA